MSIVERTMGRVAELIVRRTQVVVAQELDLRDFDVRVDIQRSHHTDAMAMRLVAYLACNTIHREVQATERIPATWWDGFKAAWFPRWALRRWPVSERVIETEVQFVHMCPHLPRFATDAAVHAIWLTSADDLRSRGIK